MNPLYQQLNKPTPIVQRFLQFKNTLNGNPQQIVQNMLDSGKITQAQVNQYAQQANELYKQLKPFI